MRCANVIGGKCTKQIVLFNSIRANLSSTKCPPEKKNFRKISNLEISLVIAQCDIEVSENLREAFANFPPIFKNIIVGRYDIGPFMKEHAEKEGLLTQSLTMQKSRYLLENGTIFTPLLLFSMNLGLVCKKNSIVLCQTLQ